MTGREGPASESGSLASTTYTSIRSQILFGELPPNDVLVEAYLAQTYGLSRTPIREALQMLATDGLIVSRRRRWYVRQYDWREIEEIYEVRACHEGLGAYLATEHLDDTSRPTLQELLGNVDVDRQLSDSRQWVIANDRFHGAIVARCGNKRLIDLIDRTKVYYFNRHVAALYSEQDRDRSSQEHADILTAILDGDSSRAEQLARSHVLGALNILRRSYGPTTFPLSGTGP
ncbi:MAG: GntR family transcriptional regulator [Actinobacteria bacterium]|nr:GntR family transcriptional regulator [Actinomycetota bacterium]